VRDAITSPFPLPYPAPQKRKEKEQMVLACSPAPCHSLLPLICHPCLDLPCQSLWEGGKAQGNYLDFLSETNLYCIYLNKIQYFSLQKLLSTYLSMWDN
jgi:hypothetical protein